MKKMKLSLTVLFLVFVFNVPAISTYAATQTMSDGTAFDPQYYAENNPDVVNVYGKTTEKLYQHYVEYGKKEGRKATSDSTAAPTAKSTTSSNSAVDTFKATYPNGTAWNADSFYRVEMVIGKDGYCKKSTGFTYTGSLGWPWLVYDTVNGLDESNRFNYHTVEISAKDAVQVGDVIWLNDTQYLPNGGLIAHCAYVTSIDAANRTLTATEGNVGGAVTWDSTYSFDDILKTTRMEKDGKGQSNVEFIIDGVIVY